MAKKQAAAVSVSDLVRMALLNVANATGDVKLSGKGGLFSSATGASKEAIEECLSATNPLLTVLRTEGKSQFVGLAPAGFERIARELAEEKVGPLAKAVAVAVPLAARADFIQSVIGRTPRASVELLPVLEEAIAAEKAEQEARLIAAQKRADADREVQAALKRAMALFEERRQNRLDALRREYEIEGGNASDLPEPEAKEAGTQADSASLPNNAKENEFRRDVVKQLAEMWRSAWNDNKAEGRDYLESAMWNISGLKMLGEPKAIVAFNGRYHECQTGVFTGDNVRVIRAGWAVEENESDFVAVKALVETV